MTRHIKTLYFIIKKNELRGLSEQFYSKVCREHTLPRYDGSSQPREWIQGNTKIGPVLEVTTSCLYGKHGVEIRISSLSEDNIHSWVLLFSILFPISNCNYFGRDGMSLCRDNTDFWVRISHGLNNFVMDSNNKDTDFPEDQPEEQALQLNVKDFAYRSKAKLAAGGGAKRRHQYCTDGSGIIYLRTLQGHSGRNLNDPSLQDNVVIQSEFFHHIYHIGCAFNLHSIINNGLTPGGQNSSKRQTVFFLPIDPRDKRAQRS